MTAESIALSEHRPVLRIEIGHVGGLSIEVESANDCGRKLEGPHVFWVAQRKETEYNISGCSLEASARLPSSCMR